MSLDRPRCQIPTIDKFENATNRKREEKEEILDLMKDLMKCIMYDTKS